MKERGMLFSAPMVRAILDGSKTQTRRIVKNTGLYAIDASVHGDETAKRELAALATRCPYGQPGDRLWVRETFASIPLRNAEGGQGGGMGWAYRADGESAFDAMPDEWEFMGKWTPSIHMPRAASRILLEITGVRVERLNDCSEADAKAEGIEAAFENTRWRMYDHRDGEENQKYVGPRWTIDPVRSYRSLWLSINGAGSWDANPWVWVIEFKRVEPGKQEFDIPNFLRKRHDDE